MATPEVEIIRSARRRRSVQAQFVDGRIQVRVPAAMSAAEEEAVVARVVAKLQRNTPRSDADLIALAHNLNAAHLQGQAQFRSIRWVRNQHKRWGSCSPATGDIRISHRLQEVPEYVLAAVVVHELVHTFISGHTAEFWSWADRVPHAERAKGYLEAYQRYGRSGET
ncbi:M48 family metallopeptidase [Corynebacterium sp.]|uniref:M48 metallopeptidase family protein n=1 Tax=Corynebacterium sp. TaxID=1720 RepID=UPI0026DCF58E|nr:SprT-like domain-containing protein [Corynebacterium sp.]MDO5077280.1 DUF45 domain-containing protein [Corynebacterium sp.]